MTTTFRRGAPDWQEAYDVAVRCYRNLLNKGLIDPDQFNRYIERINQANSGGRRHAG